MSGNTGREIDFLKSEDVGRQHVVRQATTLAALWSELPDRRPPMRL
jgi:hypothetical protein